MSQSSSDAVDQSARLSLLAAGFSEESVEEMISGARKLGEEMRQKHERDTKASWLLEERERELLALKGPCSSKACTLHYAHWGPCFG